MANPNAYFAISALGIEPVTAAELNQLGATNVQQVVGGVHFQGELELLYRANLWLRTATRILRPLREFAAVTPEMLYSQTRRIVWESYLNPTKTFAVSATMAAAGSSRRPAYDRGGGESRGPRSRGIENTQFAALKVKDAIVDRLRREQGERPNVDRENPDIRIHAHFAAGRCTISVDASGASLHERGYRVHGAAAPLKETLASAIIDLTGWNGESPLVDPMCGSGTLVIEAALKAMHKAPALLRQKFGFEGWPDFDPALWEQVRTAARESLRITPPPLIVATDINPDAIAAARLNAQQAGVDHVIRFEVQSAVDCKRPSDVPGVIVVNPPYGNRIGDEAELKTLYHALGENWKREFAGWSACFLAGNLPLAREIGLRASEKIRLFNGPLECRLLKFDLFQ